MEVGCLFCEVLECAIFDRREVGAWFFFAKCKSHVHVCCFGEIREGVEACEGVFYCVVFNVSEDELVVV